MYSLVLSGTPGKGGPSELEEPEQVSSLHRKEAEKLEIEVEQKHGRPRWKKGGPTPRSDGSPAEPQRDPHRSAWSPPLLQEGLGFLLKEGERRLCS